MKLVLQTYKDVSILVASGTVTHDNFAVLKAGIKKLFKDGKIRIILELPDASSFPKETLQELAALNTLASELSGQIVLAEIEPLVRLKIESFSKPPLVRCFMTRDEAIEFFVPGHKPEASAPAAAAPGTATAAAPVAQPAAGAPAGADAPAGAVPAAVTNTAEFAKLEAENLHLRKQLESLILQRREAPDLKAAQEKIELMEKQIDELVTQLNAPPKPKA